MARWAVVSVALLMGGILLLGTALAASSSSFTLPWSLFSSGGQPMASTRYGLNSTLGQGPIGEAESNNYTLGSGFWYGTGHVIQVTPSATVTPSPTPTATGAPTVTPTSWATEVPSPTPTPTPTSVGGLPHRVYLPAVMVDAGTEMMLPTSTRSASLR